MRNVCAESTVLKADARRRSDVAPNRNRLSSFVFCSLLLRLAFLLRRRRTKRFQRRENRRRIACPATRFRLTVRFASRLLSRFPFPTKTATQKSPSPTPKKRTPRRVPSDLERTPPCLNYTPLDGNQVKCELPFEISESLRSSISIYSR